MDKIKLKETVESNLRSVTQSCKGGVPFGRLNRDYRDLLGTEIPYKELGYNTLEQFIRDIPHVITLEKDHSTGQLVAVGKADQATAHIVSLVSRQKKVEKRPTRFKRPYRVGFPVKRAPPPRYTPRRSLPDRTHDSYKSNDTTRYEARSPTPHRHSPPPQQLSRNRGPLIPRAAPNKKTYEIAPRFLRLQGRQSAAARVEEPQIPEPSVTHEETRVPRFENHRSELYTSFEEPRAENMVPRKIASPIRTVRKVYNDIQTPTPDPIRQPKLFLQHYAEKKNISIEYKTKRFGQKKEKTYYSSLYLDGKEYKTYPNQNDTQEEAEAEAARMAVADIKEKELKDLFPETMIDNADSQQVFIDRILEIVCEKPTGIFEIGVESEYENKFKETLPDDWLTIIKNNTELEVVVPTATHLPKGASFLLRAKGNSSSGYTTPSSTSSKNEMPNTEVDATTLTNSLYNSGRPITRIPPIKLPEGNQWSVFVSYVASTTTIACRLVDYASDFADMSDEMLSHYQSRKYPVQDAFENHLYAAFFDNDDEGLWHRVLINAIGPDGQDISCYLVDDGDYQEMHISNLQELDPQFMQLPFQALHFKLADLEQYENIVKLEHLENNLLGKTLIAEVQRADDDELYTYAVNLYDTSGEDDINLNEYLREVTILESLKWELPKIGTTSIAYLTHVTENGEIFLRFNCPHQSILEAEMQKLSPQFEVAARSSSIDTTVGKVWAAKYEDGSWYRAVITETAADSAFSQVNVLYIDYGNTDLVSVNSVCELEPISMILAQLPAQARKCGLHNVAPSSISDNWIWTPSAIDALVALAPIDEELIARVETEADEIKLPIVNLFIRNKDSFIISINETLASRPELFRKSSTAKTPEEAGPSRPYLPLKTSGMQLPLNTKMNSPTDTSSLSSFLPDVALHAAVAEEQQMARKLVAKGPAGDTGIKWVATPDISTPLDANKSSPPLRFPEIPDIGKDFDVLITVAASPSNFVVQPYKSGADLDNLMQNMQAFYSEEENFVDMHSSLIKVNDYYAALHEDKVWYRVRISQVILEDPVTVAVHFVDYGDFGTVIMSNLQNLWQQFRDLPCQAIRASLAGVKPHGLDWDPMQCFAFQELVKQKAFVSIIRGKEASKDCHFPMVIELSLIDTSEEIDVHIHELLIQKNIARPISRAS